MLLLLYFLVLLAGIIEATVLPIPLTLLLIYIAILETNQTSLYLCFLAGIMLDLLSLTTVGSHSLFFLAVSWLVFRYQKKLYFGNYFYKFLFFALLTGVYNFVFFRYIDPLYHGFIILINLSLLFIIIRFFPNAARRSYKIAI